MTRVDLMGIGPDTVIRLTTRFVRTFERVRSKEITLGLNEIGWETSSAVLIEVTK
jgi:hypothetical protein